jgi:NhaC family Na+:H+ antiporter
MMGMELIILGIFAGAIIACISQNISILYALCFGYALFFACARRSGLASREIFSLSLQGIRTVKTILLAFVFIGMLTASWRADGTIATIIYYSSVLMVPSLYLLITFLLNCFVSVLTGTSFGTMATIGVICMTIGNIMGIDPALLGGASLSGIYVGDRCSPMSTSALLVAGLTKTDLYRNIWLMVRTAAVPFVVTCLLYVLLGLTNTSALPDLTILKVFPAYFDLSLWTLLPALVIIVMSLARIPVIKTMAVSTACAVVIGLLVQSLSFKELALTLLLGFHASDSVLSTMMDGGGILSMLNVGAIVCISASYFNIFDKIGLLTAIERQVAALTGRITQYGSAIVLSALAAMLACNQSLAIMLTYQLYKKVQPDKERLAILLENTVVLIAALIPWNIAVAVPLATWHVPLLSIAFAFYLYAVPLWNLAVQRK